MLERVPPIWLAAASAVLGGTSLVASRYAVTEVDPVEITFVRYGFATLLFGLAAYATTGRVPRVTRADLLPTFALGVMMFAAFGWFFTAATQYIPAARAALIMAVMPVAALVFAWTLGRERAAWPQALACALGAAGVAVALGDKATGGPEAWRGDAFMIVAALIGGAHTVLSADYVRRYSPVPQIALQCLAGTLALGLVLLATGRFPDLSVYSTGSWIAVVWLAIPGAFMSFYLWFRALERIPASRVALCVPLNPLAAALGGAILLGEAVGPLLLVGFVFVAASIVLATRGREGR